MVSVILRLVNLPGPGQGRRWKGALFVSDQAQPGIMDPRWPESS